LGFCRERHASQQEDKNHQHLEHNPLKSRNEQLDHLNPYAVYDNLDDSSGEDSTDEDCPDKGGLEYSTKDKIGINLGNRMTLLITVEITQTVSSVLPLPKYKSD
jgi:hypothetical protein